jgi:hypothetical protein
MCPPALIRRGKDSMPGRIVTFYIGLGHNGARIARNRNLAASRRFPRLLGSPHSS